MRDRKRFQGCLIGGAAGDALGYAVEFMQADSIHQKYGPLGITEYELRHGKAEISDDTQMTLFTATGLLVGTTRGMTRGIMGTYQSYINFSYGDWLKTQEERYPLPGEYHYSWLVNVPELFSRRAPGNTCLQALRQGGNGSVDHPINNSKGCGGIMRVAPIGLYFIDKRIPIEEVDRIAAETAALTHGHELGYIPAAALAHIIQRVAESEATDLMLAVKDAMAAMERLFPQASHLSELLALMQKAIDLAKSDMNDLAAIRELGEGWVAEETLAIAIYCALKYSGDFDKGIIAAVNHDGDSDSTGAVVGNILGACLGIDGIPEKYREHLELREVILELADDLCADCKISEHDDDWDPIWEQKYIEMSYRK